MRRSAHLLPPQGCLAKQPPSNLGRLQPRRGECATRRLGKCKALVLARGRGRPPRCTPLRPCRTSTAAHEQTWCICVGYSCTDMMIGSGSQIRGSSSFGFAKRTASVMAPWILPIAVNTPVPMTMHLALPAVTTVPCFRSACRQPRRSEPSIIALARLQLANGRAACSSRCTSHKNSLRKDAQQGCA